ncbi:hypothetical protein [Nitrosomonas communis]|nr:hypothetical protein [Nitrosomonas communis]
MAAKDLSRQELLGRLRSALEKDTQKATYKCFNKKLSTLKKGQLNVFFTDIANLTYAILRIERVDQQEFQRKCSAMADSLDEISLFIGGNVKLPLSHGVKEEADEDQIVDIGIPAKFSNTILYMRRCLPPVARNISPKEVDLKKETRKALKSIDSEYASRRASLAHMLPLLADDLREFAKTPLYNWDGLPTSYSSQLNTSGNINTALVYGLADFLSESILKIKSDTFLAQLISILLDQNWDRTRVKNILASRFKKNSGTKFE